jgi:hypothetical protein
MPQAETLWRMSLRMYLVDGPGAGHSLLAPRAPAQLDWDRHRYRRVVHFGSTYFYRHSTPG